MSESRAEMAKSLRSYTGAGIRDCLDAADATSTFEDAVSFLQRKGTPLETRVETADFRRGASRERAAVVRWLRAHHADARLIRAIERLEHHA